MNDLKTKWENGKKSSIRFYDRKAYWKFKAANKIIPLHDYFSKMIGNKKK